MKTFIDAIAGIKRNNELWKRKVIKNDTVITCYKKRLYQMSQNTGVRYPYTPTNADIMATDWIKVMPLKFVHEKNTNEFQPIETLTYEATGGKKFIGKNKYGCISTARISNSGIKSDDEAILPFTHWLPFL